jgi:hypothetical protein
MKRPVTFAIVCALSCSIGPGVGRFAEAQSSTRSVQARSADSFVDSIGVVTHVGYDDKTPYRNRWDEIRWILNDLGVRYVRDDVANVERLNQLADDGIGVVGLVYPNEQKRLQEHRLDEYMNYAAELRGLVALEGPNEHDAGVGTQDWVGDLERFMTAMRTYRDSDPRLQAIPILAPALASIGSDPGPNIKNVVDAGNMHSYPGGLQPSNGLSAWLEKSKRNAGSDSVWATETGYHYALGETRLQAGVTPVVGGKYTPRMYAEYYRAGVTKTFNYSLLSEGLGTPADPTCSECQYGLYDYDLKPRPAALAMKRLIALLEEPGSDFSPGSISYGVQGDSQYVKDVLLQKGDGRYFLLLWADSMLQYPYGAERNVADKDVSLVVPEGVNAVKIHRFDDIGELRSSTVAVTNRRIGLQVPPAVLIIEFAV